MARDPDSLGPGRLWSLLSGPTIVQISGPQAHSRLRCFPDPFRGNELIVYPVNMVSGPNSNLKPETGDALTWGLNFQAGRYRVCMPRQLGTISRSRISSTLESLQALVDFPEPFPGGHRPCAAPATDRKGYLGVITQLNDLYYNFGDLRVAGFDADISYAIDTRVGRFTPSVSIANLYKWVTALVPGAPSVEGVSVETQGGGFGGGLGLVAPLEGHGGAGMETRAALDEPRGRYIGKYLDYQNVVTSTHKLGNYWIFDFYARYEVGKALKNPGSWLAGSYVALGAVNVFNKPPPFSYTPFWYDYQEYDIRARYLHFDAGLRF